MGYVVPKLSWKDRGVGKCKVKKSEVGKSLFQLERAELNWKFSFEFGKSLFQLERAELNWKFSFEVGTFRCSWKFWNARSFTLDDFILYSS